MQQKIQIQQLIDERYSEYKSFIKEDLVNELAKQLVKNNFADITEEPYGDGMRLIKLTFEFNDLKEKGGETALKTSEITSCHKAY